MNPVSPQPAEQPEPRDRGMSSPSVGNGAVSYPEVEEYASGALTVPEDDGTDFPDLPESGDEVPDLGFLVDLGDSSDVGDGEPSSNAKAQPPEAEAWTVEENMPHTDGPALSSAGGMGNSGGPGGPKNPPTPAAPDGDEPEGEPPSPTLEPLASAVEQMPHWQVNILRDAIKRATAAAEPDSEEIAGGEDGQAGSMLDSDAAAREHLSELGSEVEVPDAEPETSVEIDDSLAEGVPPQEPDAAFDELAFLDRPGAFADAAVDSAPLLVLVPRVTETGVSYSAQPVMPGKLEKEIARDGLNGLQAQSELGDTRAGLADEYLLQQRALHSRAEAALRVDLDGYYHTLVEMGRAIEGTIPASQMAHALNEYLEELGERGVAPLTVARSAGERIDAAMSGLVAEILGATQPGVKPDTKALAELSQEYTRLAGHATACAASLAEHDDPLERAMQLATFVVESADIVRETSLAGAALDALPDDVTAHIASASASLTDEQRGELATIDNSSALADFARRITSDAAIARALTAALDDVRERTAAMTAAYEALNARFFPIGEDPREEITPTSFAHISGDTQESLITEARAGTLTLPSLADPEQTVQPESPEPTPEPILDWVPPIDLSGEIVDRREVHIPALEKGDDGWGRFVIDTLSLPVSDNPLAKIYDIERQAREGLDRARARERALNGYRLAEGSDTPDNVVMHDNTAVVVVSDPSSGSTIEFAQEQVWLYDQLLRRVEEFKERITESEELDPRQADAGFAEVMGSVTGIQERAFSHRRAVDGYDELQSQMDEPLWGTAKERPSCELFQTNQDLFRLDLETRVDALSEPLYDTTSTASPMDRRRQVAAGLTDLKERIAAVHSAMQAVPEGQSAFFVSGAMLQDIDNICDELTAADNPKFGPGEIEGISERLEELKTLNPFGNRRLPERALVDLTTATPPPPPPADRWPGFHQPFTPPKQALPLKLDLPLENGFDRVDLPELRLGGTDTELASDVRALLHRLEQAAGAVDIDTVSENRLRRDRGEAVLEPGSFVDEVQAARQRLEPQLVAPTPEKIRVVLREVDRLLTEAVLRPINAHQDANQLYPLRDGLANSRTGVDSNPMSAAIYVRLLGDAFDVKLGEATREIEAMVRKLEVGNPATWQELDGFVKDRKKFAQLLKLANVAQGAASDLPEAREQLMRTHRLVQGARAAVGQARQRAADETDAQGDEPRAPTEMSMARLRFALDQLRTIAATTKWPDVDAWTLDAIYEHCRPDDPGGRGPEPPRPGQGPRPPASPPNPRPTNKPAR